MSDFRHVPLIEAPACGSCPARETCPAIGMIAIIAEANADLSVASDELVGKYEAGVFVYSTNKLAKETAEAQKAIDTCKGSLDYSLNDPEEDPSVRHAPLVRSVNASFRSNTAEKPATVHHTDEELLEKGIEVKDEVNDLFRYNTYITTLNTTDRTTPDLLTVPGKDVFKNFRESLNPATTNSEGNESMLAHLTDTIIALEIKLSQRISATEGGLERVRQDVRYMENDLHNAVGQIRILESNQNNGSSGYYR